MKSVTRHGAVGAVLALAAVGVAFACGFNFRASLLDNRHGSLLGMKTTDWMSAQIMDLYPQPTDDLKAVEGLITEVVERRDVEESLAPRIAAMRSSPDGAAAYAAGEGLPEAVRLYIAGAVEYKAAAAAVEAHEDPSEHSGAALAYFERVLGLPADQRASRATWASYMAGRVSYMMGRTERTTTAAAPTEATALTDAAATTEAAAATATATDRAITFFQQTRDLARQGQPDPLGLAVASYGEEARIALEKDDIPHAIQLYLEQAARNSSVAFESLRTVARRLVQDPDFALRHIQDPTVQKLWFAGVLAEGQNEYYFERPDEYDDVPGYHPKSSWVVRVNKVTATLDRTRVSQLDQLAALSYATGRFDLAESLAAGVSTPLAAVVRAKLALRAGNRDAAAKEYATAVSSPARSDAAGEAGSAAEAGETGLNFGARSRALAEIGVLAMSRSDYADALRILLEAGSRYWREAAYVAERVLTLDELVAFVSEYVPAKPVAGGNEGAQTAYDRDYFGEPNDPPRALRLLLARRQLREQKFDEALQTFRSSDFALDEEHKSLAAVADEYVSAIRGGTSAWTGVGRATDLFRAARLAKQFGMELMGYELAPDYAAYNGRFSLGEQPLKEGPYATADEIARRAANPVPEKRYHYRDVALDLAKRAADDLPPRSHAFAAVLCTSLRWARSNRDHVLAREIYQRYVREGAYVDWSEKFGGRCETPDFPRATSLLWHTRIHSARVALRPYKIPIVLLVTGVVLGVGVFAVRRYRQKSTPSH